MSHINCFMIPYFFKNLTVANWLYLDFYLQASKIKFKNMNKDYDE